MSEADPIFISYVIGDATAPLTRGPKIIAHVCNDIGAWGKGFVLAISDRWSDPEKEYKKWYKEKESNDFGLGSVLLAQVEDDIWVANMIGQRDIRRSKGKPPLRYEAVEKCLDKVASYALDLGANVHMPRIGCGLAGGKWEEIEPIINRQLCSKGIEVYVYDLG